MRWRGFGLALGRRHVSKTGRQLSELGGGAASDAGVHPISGVVPVLMDKHIIPPISHLPTRRVKQMEGSAEPASLAAKEGEVKKEQLSFRSTERVFGQSEFFFFFFLSFNSLQWLRILDVKLLPLNASRERQLLFW